MAEQNVGKIVQVIGAVLDIKFSGGHMPALNNAIEIHDGDRKIVAEVSKHLGDDVVKCIAMSSTDGLKRGMDAIDTGKPISVPVGRETLGRMFNVVGEPIDDKPMPTTEEMRGRMAIYEIMPVSDALKRLIVDKADANVLGACALSEAMRNLRHDGMLKVIAGLTSLTEVARVTNE